MIHWWTESRMTYTVFGEKAGKWCADGKQHMDSLKRRNARVVCFHLVSTSQKTKWSSITST